MIRRTPLRRKTPLRSKAVGGRVRRSKKKVNYKKRLWAIFSEYIRRKYADHAGMVSCVSCGKADHWKRMDAGHYVPKSLGLSIYFEERSVWPQCTACNRFRHGNLTQYALFLQKTFGPKILEELDAQRREVRKISESEYLELIATYKEKLKGLDKPGEAA